MRLGCALQNARSVLNLPSRLCECLPHGNANMLLLGLIATQMAHNNFFVLRDMDVDPHFEEPTTVMALLRGRDGHAARDNAAVKLFELFDLLLDSCSYRRVIDRRIDHDMRGDFHSFLQTARASTEQAAYVLAFRRLLAPVLIRIIYYIGAASIILGGILDLFGVDHLAERAQAQPPSTAEYFAYNLPHNPVIVLISIPIALIVWRVWCELWIIIFQIDDRLREIRDGLQGR